MPDSTPVYGLPYALAADARGQGAETIRDLAYATEAELARLDRRPWAEADRRAQGVNLGGGVWAPVTYETMTADEFAGSGWDTFTYQGPSGLWHLLSFGVSLWGAEGATSTEARLLVNGYPVTTTVHGLGGSSGGGGAPHGAAIPATLTNGDAIKVEAKVTGVTGSFSAGFGDAFLRVVGL